MSKEEVKSVNNDLGIVSFVLGLLSIALFFTIIPSIIFAILGIVFGFIQRKKHKNKFALAGIILSVLGIIFSLCLIWFFVSVFIEITELARACMEDPTRAGCENLAPYLNQNQLTQYG